MLALIGAGRLYLARGRERPPRRADGGGRRRCPGARAGSLRRGSELAVGRIARGLGVPALFAIMLSAVVASIFFSLGVVAGDALGLTPRVYLLAGVFLMVTIATYVEGSSLHPERGGASTFARYAFDELWSFIAGWAILLDYLIVMAAGAVVITRLPGRLLERPRRRAARGDRRRAGARCFVAVLNVRGLHAERLGSVLRMSLVAIFLLLLVVDRRVHRLLRPGAIPDSVEFGEAPPWEDAIFAFGVASHRPDRGRGRLGPGRRGAGRPARPAPRGLHLHAGGGDARARGVSCAGLMAQPVVDGAHAARRPLHGGAGARHRDAYDTDGCARPAATSWATAAA